MRKVIKKNNYLFGAGIALAVLFAIVGVVGIAKAFDFWGDAAKQAGNRAYEDNKSALVFNAGIGNSIGAASADGYCAGDEAIIQIGCNARVQYFTTETLTVSGDVDFSGTFDLDDLDTIVTSGTFADATNTLACVANPFSASSTVDLAEVLVTGYSTTTFAMNVGTSTATAITGLTTTTVASNGLNIMTIPTITGTSTGVAINLINYGTAGTYAAGTVARMAVAPTEYVCFVAGEGSGGSTAGVTGGANTFAGTYKLRWLK